MREIKELIKSKGYKYTGKSVLGEDMFEKGNSVIYIKKMTFKKEKELSFEEMTKTMYK